MLTIHCTYIKRITAVYAGEAKPEVKSETMKFVLQIRETAAQQQDGLNELSDVITFIPKVEAYSLKANKNMVAFFDTGCFS